MNQEREIRRDLRIDETPYPAITTVRKTTKPSCTGFGEFRCRQIHITPPKAKNMKRKPRIWCQRECTGFTAAGATVLRKRPDCRANWPDWRANWLDWRAEGIHRRARRPATRHSCCGLATPQCYQTGRSQAPCAKQAPNRSIVRRAFDLYNQGDWRLEPTRQPMALNLHLYNREAPEERGRTWKSV
jgi:hypothetical protein